MTDIVFNKKKSELVAEENETCRQIVKEIVKFGVNERQKLYIINLLALELVNHEQMMELVGCVKSLEDTVPDLFLKNDE